MKKILIVDDEQKIRDVYLKVLTSAGFTSYCADGAQAALGYLVREDIDLVLLDIKMPKIDGRTTFEILREYNPKVKIIVSSVFPLEQQKQLMPQATDYFDKSEGSAKMLKKVEHNLAA